MGVVMLMAIVGAFIGGFLADKWQETCPRSRMLLNGASDLLAAACATTALLLDVDGAGYLLMCIWGVMAVVGLPPLSTVTQDVADPASKALSYGVGIFLSHVLGGAWGPVAAGASLQNES